MKPEIVTLRDSKTGSSAEILASLGFNCFRFTAVTAAGPVEVLYAHPNFASGIERPSGSGIPLLFPFPGRIPGSTFVWEGKKYELEPSDAFGNAIHGFCHKRPWRVIEQSEDRVVGQFHAFRDDPTLKDKWPADFRITATYVLHGNRLASEFQLENPDDVPLPCGFGTHPYFRVPLGGPNADECLVKLPVAAQWELEKMLPTGKRIDLANAGQFQRGQRFAELKFDDVFTGLQFANGRCAAAIADPAGATMTIDWDDHFRECVVYTPPHRQAICIEPLTCAPTAAALAERGIEAGWKLLAPGKSLVVKVAMEVQ
ncbi:MAG: aldose 1-epimerase [Pirellulaceae bacterium]|nr:aldose 1-epimerase [Pirellulaceae bacterium]